MGEAIEHLVLIRHGEDEGDVRRAAWRRGELIAATKVREREEITPTGEEQSRRAGLWIQEYVVKAYDLTSFDGCYVSSALRSEQSAAALGLTSAVWQEDHDLDERNRGRIRGLRPEQHRKLYPRSFEQMNESPQQWLPPGGESLVPDVTARVRRFMQNIEGARAVVVETHRDWIWAAGIVLGFAVNTDDIHNGQVIHLTSLNPDTGEQASDLRWIRSIDPAAVTGAGEWQAIPHTLDTDAAA
jgi:broad specificity phosphatase PhoE